MTYDNKNKKIEKDDLGIRKHLNTSLDIEGVHPSDDLKKRTLQAIKGEEKQKNSEESSLEDYSGEQMFKRVSRFITSVAAAVIFIVVASNLLTNMIGAGKKSMDDNASDMVKSAEEAHIEDQDMNIAENKSIEPTADLYDNDNESADLYFREIMTILARDVNWIIIKDLDSDVEISLSDSREIDEFYTSMEEYGYSKVAKEEGESKKLLGEKEYVIEVNSDSGSLILYISDNVLIEYDTEDEKTSEVYIATRKEDLVKDLDDLIDGYK